MEGVCEQVVAQEDGGFIAPLGVHGGGVPADNGLIEDVVVDEGGRVDHLDDGGQDGVGTCEVSAGAAGQEHEGRSETFAVEVGAMLDELLNERVSAMELVGEDLFGLVELGGDGGIGLSQGAPGVLGLPQHGNAHPSTPEP